MCSLAHFRSVSTRAELFIIAQCTLNDPGKNIFFRVLAVVTAQEWLGATFEAAAAVIAHTVVV
jgi:hypothetical protein